MALLVFLAYAGKPITYRGAADAIGTEKYSVSKAINALVELGLVLRDSSSRVITFLLPDDIPISGDPDHLVRSIKDSGADPESLSRIDELCALAHTALAKRRVQIPRVGAAPSQLKPTLLKMLLSSATEAELVEIQDSARHQVPMGHSSQIGETLLEAGVLACKTLDETNLNPEFARWFGQVVPHNSKTVQELVSRFAWFEEDMLQSFFVRKAFPTPQEAGQVDRFTQTHQFYGAALIYGELFEATLDELATLQLKMLIRRVKSEPTLRQHAFQTYSGGVEEAIEDLSRYLGSSELLERFRQRSLEMELMNGVVLQDQEIARGSGGLQALKPRLRLRLDSMKVGVQEEPSRSTGGTYTTTIHGNVHQIYIGDRK